MSREVIPEQFRHPFKPLGHIAHDQVAEKAMETFLTESGPSTNVSVLFERLNVDCPALIKRISDVAKYVEPYNDELELIDSSGIRYGVYMSGTTIGLVFASVYASALGIDDHKWQSAWIESPRAYDFPAFTIAGDTISSKECSDIGEMLLELGENNMNLLEEPYRVAIDTISAFHPSAAVYDRIYRSAFAYTFDIGKNIVTKIAEDSSYDVAVHAVIPDTDFAKPDSTLDNAYKILLESELPNA